MRQKGQLTMLDVDYEEGLTQLRKLVERQKPELFNEFSLFEHRLSEKLAYQRRYGQSSNNAAELNEVLHELIQFTNDHFALQFIDLCRPKHTLDAMPSSADVHASTVDLYAEIWQRGGEVHIRESRYMLHEPVETAWAPDRSALLQRAKALEIDTDRQVLLKQVQLRRATAHAEAWKTALEKERRLLALLEQRSPAGFPRLLAFEQTTRAVTLVQSVVPGLSWWQIFRPSDTPLNMQETQSLLRSAMALCRLLSTLHAQRLAHRALTPEKIFLVDRRQMRLQDVGLATWKFVPGEGPVLYRAPEQAISNTSRALPGPATDVYQLGIILYHLITGKEPAPLQQVLPLHVWNTSFPTELDAALQQAIAPNVEERWHNSAEFSAALRKVPF
ncbi:MAG: protein kinase [Chloroflexota bacterium]|nr:protein kinase [Chloroflexota bacterium]